MIRVRWRTGTWQEREDAWYANTANVSDRFAYARRLGARILPSLLLGYSTITFDPDEQLPQIVIVGEDCLRDQP